MVEEVVDIWENTLNNIKKEMTEQSFETWFKSIKPVKISEDTLIIEVPYKFFKDWLNEHYLPLIEKSVKKVTQRELNIDFLVSSTKSEDKKPEFKQDFKRDLSEESPVPLTILNPKYTFESFVVGANNRFAHAASLAVAESPSNAYNPLFIYGGVGLGKTHLMQATGHYLRNRFSKIKVAYVSSEKFTNELINSLQHGHESILGFRNKYRSVDVLLIDDIHFLANKERTQEEFFHTFNTLHDARKQIVVSSDRPPKEIPSLEERLISRFEWGLVADLQPPDLETRVAILQKKAELEQFHIPEEVNFFIADQIKSNIRELEGALIKVAAFASLSGEEVTVGLATKILKEFLPQGGTIISVELIQKIVASYFHLQTSDMKVKKRTQVIAFPRQIAMYLTRELTDFSLPEIGEKFGGRDHTTVMHAYNKINKKRERNLEFNKVIQELIFKIKK